MPPIFEFQSLCRCLVPCSTGLEYNERAGSDLVRHQHRGKAEMVVVGSLPPIADLRVQVTRNRNPENPFSHSLARLSSRQFRPECASAHLPPAMRRTAQLDSWRLPDQTPLSGDPRRLANHSDPVVLAMERPLAAREQHRWQLKTDPFR